MGDIPVLAFFIWKIIKIPSKMKSLEISLQLVCSLLIHTDFKEIRG